MDNKIVRWLRYRYMRIWTRRRIREVFERSDKPKMAVLPGSSDRIEKAMVFPTTNASNPFLKRLDPEKVSDKGWVIPKGEWECPAFLKGMESWSGSHI